MPRLTQQQRDERAAAKTAKAAERAKKAAKEAEKESQGRSKGSSKGSKGSREEEEAVQKDRVYWIMLYVVRSVTTRRRQTRQSSNARVPNNR